MNDKTATENISQILELREQTPEGAGQLRQLSRLARAACVLGVIAPFSLAFIFVLPRTSSSGESILLLPFVVSGAASVLSVVAMLRVAVAGNRKKGLVLALIGFLLGGGTLAAVTFVFLAAESIKHCPFFG